MTEDFFAKIERELQGNSKKFKADRAKMIYVQNKDFGSIKFAPINLKSNGMPCTKCEVFEYNGFTNRFKNENGSPKDLRYRFLLDKNLYLNEVEIDSDLYNETKQLLWEMKDYIEFEEGKNAYKTMQRVNYSLMYGYIISTNIQNQNIKDSVGKPVCLVFNKQDVHHNLYDAIKKEREDLNGDIKWVSSIMGPSVKGRDGLFEINIKPKANGQKGSDYSVSLVWNTEGPRARQVIDPNFEVPETDYDLFGDPVKDLCGYLCDKDGNLWNYDVIKELHDQLIERLKDGGIEMIKGEDGKITFEGDGAIKAAKAAKKNNPAAEDNAENEGTSDEVADTVTAPKKTAAKKSASAVSAGSEDIAFDIPF